MRVEVIYTNKSKHIKPVAEAMARWVKTYAKSINDFDKNATIDLLLIGFDDSVRKDSELENFIKNLDRKNVHNIALFNAFYLNDHKMTNMIKLCQETNLPLMREQYSFKLTFYLNISIQEFKFFNLLIIINYLLPSFYANTN